MDEPASIPIPWFDNSMFPHVSFPPIASTVVPSPGGMTVSQSFDLNTTATKSQCVDEDSFPTTGYRYYQNSSMTMAVQLGEATMSGEMNLSELYQLVMQSKIDWNTILWHPLFGHKKYRLYQIPDLINLFKVFTLHCC
ncbi:hypothetical protein RFI_29482 [Reticulomyxa filosa]|uniref:Uncharacterized protein n=1 Tax=Reticulomyxa filosa TaxID=46433 RepID=X6M222_RETFI|nr:hypothetical protein RFI_29482 [Reticulomyxa filosa]|eukprot:ETO07909.1 hypothetical protein RFI_29482 [Reticulomyxa filosa]